MRDLFFRWGRPYGYGLFGILYGILRKIDEAVGIASLPDSLAFLFGGPSVMTTVVISVSATVFVLYLWAYFSAHLWPEPTTTPDAPVRGFRPPESSTWLERPMARALVRQSSAVLKVKASHGRSGTVGALQDHIDRIDGSNRIKFQDAQIDETTTHYLEKAVTEFPEIEMDGKYGKEALQWWLNREATRL